MKLSNKLAKYGKQYKQDPYRSLAIAMQESSLKMINRKDQVIVFKKHCKAAGTCTKSYKVIDGVTDVGLFQFHVKTILAYKLDPIRLQTDLDYSVSTHFKVLSDKLKQCKSLKQYAWSCYHSKTPTLRKHYAKKVNHYYRKIQPTKHTKKQYTQRKNRLKTINQNIKLPQPKATVRVNFQH